MPLEFLPTPDVEELSVRAQVRAFAEDKIRPTAVKDDEASQFRRDQFEALAKMGLTAIWVPKVFGGQGKSSRAYYASLEELARASCALSVSVGVTNLIQGAIAAMGSEWQKKEILPRLTSGEWLGAFSLSEPQSGSDAASLRCAARRVSGGYSITGTKVWCSNAADADVFLVMVRTGEHRYKGISSLLVRRDSPGFHVGKLEKKLGLKASSLAELVFEDCFVPENHRVADEGDGFAVALSQLAAGRISIGCAGIGLAIEALERVWKFALEEEAEGREFFDGNKQALAEYYARAQALRTLVTAAATLKDRGQNLNVIASQIKLLGSELGMQVTSDAVTFAGMRGYTKELELERLMRDAKALQIVEGTNQIQRLVLARESESMMMNP